MCRGFDTGKIQLPQFQRDYVWKPTKIRNQLDSLVKGFPIGGFYLWRPTSATLDPKSKGGNACEGLNVVVNSARELAYAMNERLRLGLTPRPWNMYSPADTFWWLVPSTEWPAYCYGKLAFSLAKDAPRKDLLGLNDSVLAIDQVFAGFNVEKGYGAVATVVNPALRGKPAQLIDPNWLWFELIDGPGSVRFSDTLAKAASNAQMYFYVVSSYVHDRQADTHAEHDAVMFKCTPRGLELMLHKLPVGVLNGAQNATSFASLANGLRRIDDYHWVDIYVGTHVPKGQVDLMDLHARVLSYFDAWLR